MYRWSVHEISGHSTQPARLLADGANVCIHSGKLPFLRLLGVDPLDDDVQFLLGKKIINQVIKPFFVLFLKSETFSTVYYCF